jgi:hypothetical protein
LKKSIIVRNVDGTRNAAGKIEYETRIQYAIGDQEFDEWFLVTSLGDQKMILGMPWLESHNPRINWKRKTIELVDWNKERGRSLNQITQVINWIKKERPIVDVSTCMVEEDVATALVDHEHTWIRAKEMANYLEDQDLEENWHAVNGNEETAWVRVKQSFSQQFAQQAEEKKDKNIG